MRHGIAILAVFFFFLLEAEVYVLDKDEASYCKWWRSATKLFLLKYFLAFILLGN